MEKRVPYGSHPQYLRIQVLTAGFNSSSDLAVGTSSRSVWENAPIILVSKSLSPLTTIPSKKRLRYCRSYSSAPASQSINKLGKSRRHYKTMDCRGWICLQWSRCTDRLSGIERSIRKQLEGGTLVGLLKHCKTGKLTRAWQCQRAQSAATALPNCLTY